jgi:hypothetical protein
MTDTSPAARPSRSSARRARRRAAASRPAASSSTTPRRTDSRRQHRGNRPDPYTAPDSAAIAAHSMLPRPLTVVFDVTDGPKVIAALAASPDTADLADAVAAKLAWTEAYNAALPAASRPADARPGKSSSARRRP